MQKASDIANLGMHSDPGIESDPDADIVMYSDPITDVRDNPDALLSPHALTRSTGRRE